MPPRNNKTREEDFGSIVKAVAAVVGLMAVTFGIGQSISSGPISPITSILVGFVIALVLVASKRLKIITALIILLFFGIVFFMIYYVITLPVTVSGRIIDGNAKPVQGLTLMLTDSSGVDHKAVTGIDGEYEIRNVPEGRFTIMLANGKLLTSGEIPSGWQRIRPIFPMLDVVYEANSIPTPTPVATDSPFDTPTPSTPDPNTPVPTIPPESPPDPCVGITANSLILPTGVRKPDPKGENVPELYENTSIVWCPLDSRMDVEFFKGGVPVRKYFSKLPGEIDTGYFIKDFGPAHVKKSDWIEIKIYIPGKEQADNVHIKLPDPKSTPCSNATVTSPTISSTNHTMVSWTPASCLMIVQVYQQEKVKSFEPIFSGMIDTRLFEMSGQVEIKLWIPGSPVPNPPITITVP